MKEILALLVLLCVRTTTPYRPDSDGRCRNSTTEYVVNNRCCKKCPPGQRLSQKCSDTTESVCKQCDPNQYMEKWNYAPNCSPCRICKPYKGLQYAQNCSSITRAGCVCKPGMYCIVEFDDPYCAECRKYRLCKAGSGVSVPGTAYSDVRCERCPNGMFSNTSSLTDPCRPHTECHGKAVARKGNAASDNLCEEGAVISTLLPDTTKGYHPGTLFSTADTIRSTVLAISDATLSVSASVSNEVFNHSTTSLPPYKAPGISLAAVIAGVIGFLLIFIIIILVFLCKAVRSKDAEKFHPKVDANGNCESDNKQITQSYLGETQLMSFTVTCPEQQSLLDKAGACSDYSQSSNYTDTSTRTDGGGSHDSIGPLQSTLALNNSYPAVSEPMTLISNTEPVTPQPSVPSESSSQPTSPQIISPLTANPQFNVNITFHIGNGSCGTPSVTQLTESDSHLPFGEEEESFSSPQQEDGKHPLTPVQDSAS
ncbi:tumor necrosis factor receptor superfamily member 1B isoform X1 [Hippoglossus stenolepis]|uniref:tumor necrosis factor receptor superfamily member 1B isoform X1 n=2 Tax=Hippoglossus stenolepis TaxID=195615 RepID=UPI001FAFC9AB|nr:tumor necrosis factor receptor superfamily member 1B isoform X1 [Hippoglossus stenolepis]